MISNSSGSSTWSEQGRETPNEGAAVASAPLKGYGTKKLLEEFPWAATEMGPVSFQDAMGDGIEYKLSGSVGVPEGHRSAPSTFHLRYAPSPVLDLLSSIKSLHVSKSSESLSTAADSSRPSTAASITRPTGRSQELDEHAWPFFKAVSTREMVPVLDCALLTEGFENRSWGDAFGTAIVIPGLERTLQRAEEIVAERTIEIERRARDAEQRREEAEEKRKHQELLIDITSHEIRNPVSAIIQNAQVVKENLSALDKGLRESLKNGDGFSPTPTMLDEIVEDVYALDSIITMARSQSRIADDILSLAKIQMKTLEIAPVPTQLTEAVKRIASMFMNECRTKSITFSLHFGEHLQALDAGGRGVVWLDSSRLGQIFTNLISNAIRFTAVAPIRKISVNVEVRSEPPVNDSCLPPPLASGALPPEISTSQSIYVYCKVVDTGPGLTKEELASLFQRFKQASPTTHAFFGGSGMGLYICRQICGLMDGQIEVESAGPGKGSTFQFYVRASLHDIAESTPVTSPAYLHKGRRRGSTSPIKILVVEG
ncbi:hypothetical protein P7C70_g3224, partial [Phenoliferia sp. Uapishka_3]